MCPWSFWKVAFSLRNIHDDAIKWKHFPRNWPFVQGIHRPRWIPHTKASDAELWWFFFYLRLNKRLSKQPWGWWFETPPWSLWRQCNVLEFIGGQTRVAKLLHAVYSAFCLLTALCRQVLGHQQTQWWQNVVIWMYGVGAQWIKAQTLCAARNSHQTQVSRNPVRREHLF